MCKIVKLENFCNSISILGLHELYVTKHPIIRFLWGVFLLACFVMIGYFMCTIISDYQKNPTVTKAYTNLSDSYSFPETYVIVNTSSWFQSIWSDLGLSEEGIAYLNSLYEYAKIDRNDTVYKVGKEDINNFAKRFNATTISDLLTATSEQLSSVLSIQTFKAEMPSEKPSLIAMSPYTMLYKLQFKPGTRQSGIHSIANAYYLVINIKNDTRFDVSLFTGRFYQLMTETDVEALKPNYEHKVNFLNAVSYKRIKSSQFNCMIGMEKLYSSCRNNCFAKLISDCANCTTVQFGDEEFTSELCSRLKHNLDLNNINESKCLKDCPTLCEETFYQHIVTRDVLPNTYNYGVIDGYNTIAVEFQLTFIQSGIMVFEEVKSYSFISALSNVGGQLGLWLGLSLASLIQIIMYFLERCLDVIPQKKHPVQLIGMST